jgi:hypothetical protein
MPAPQTQVKIFLTGTSSVPDNFTIKIYPWDSATDAVSTTSRTYATGVSRSTTSAINGGTLNNPSNGYGISPIYQTDYRIELISTTSCTTSAVINVESPDFDEDFLTQIKSIYQPSLFAIFEPRPNTGTADGTFTSQSGYLTNTELKTLGTVEILPYLIEDNLSNLSDFIITAGTQYTPGDVVVTGDYQYGPFSSFTVTLSDKTLTLKGSPNTALPISSSTYRGTFRLTYVPSGEFSDFTYCYVPSGEV